MVNIGAGSRAVGFIFRRIYKMSDRVTGTVKWFDNAKGYGFIQQESGEDVFVHFKAIKGEGYRSLSDGQSVEFSINKGPKGLLAEDVSLAASAATT